MTNRKRMLAVLNYKKLPIVYYGFWKETMFKWHREGYIAAEVVYNTNAKHLNLKASWRSMAFVLIFATVFVLTPYIQAGSDLDWPEVKVENRPGTYWWWMGSCRGQGKHYLEPGDDAQGGYRRRSHCTYLWG